MKQLVTLHTMMFKWIIMSIQFCMCDALLSVQYRERWSHTPSTSRVFQSEIVLNLCNDFHEVEMYTLWALEPWIVFGERFYLYSRKFVEIHYLNSFNTFEFGLHVNVMSWNFFLTPFTWLTCIPEFVPLGPNHICILFLSFFR